MRVRVNSFLNLSGSVSKTRPETVNLIIDNNKTVQFHLYEIP